MYGSFKEPAIVDLFDFNFPGAGGYSSLRIQRDKKEKGSETFNQPDCPCFEYIGESTGRD